MHPKWHERTKLIPMGRDESTATSLSPYLSKLGVWAFSIGCSIGWGSFVVTSSSYLRQAGAWGSILGLLFGAAIMIVIARNYHYMVNCFPDSGGAYTYAKEVFGHDYGFIAAWFLFLTYIAVFWANVTSLPLFTHYFAGDILKTGLQYTVFGYDVYLGEAALAVCAIVLTTLVCMRSRKVAMRAMIGMALLFTVGIIGSLIACAFCQGMPLIPSEAAFSAHTSEIAQVLVVASMSPWAFIGFESVSHSAAEFSFSHSRLFRILVISIASTTALYIAVMLMSVMVHPPQYASWFEYLADLGNLSGIEALPAFYVAHRLLGDAGVMALMLSLLGLVITSLIGNMVSLSRLTYTLAKDRIVPHMLGQTNKYGIPGKAVLFIGALSLFVPFIGRTAIGWIVDVTTIGAVITYAIVSACALKVARSRGSKTERATGAIGLTIMGAFGVYLVAADLLSAHSMAPESYFLLAAWSVLGFAFFRVLLKRDRERRFGRSTIVWVGLLALVMFVGFAWMDQSLINAEQYTEDVITESYLVESEDSDTVEANHRMLEERLDAMQEKRTSTMLIAAGLFALAYLLLMGNFSHVSRWARESDEELGKAQLIVYTNPTTGLPSMARFIETAPRMAQSIREGGSTPTIVAFSLAGYRDHVENYGHDIENETLRAFARELRKVFGQERCAHPIDNRFYVLAPEEEVSSKTARLFSACADFSENRKLPIKAGAYRCLPEDDIATTGVSRARTACESDSKSWESELRWYDDTLSAEAKLRSYVMGNLEEAIEHGWIRPYYQAEVNARTHEKCGEEALARWVDPTMGFLSPGQFIPALEEAGLLYKADLHMIDCVLKDFERKKQMGIPIVPVSVNISMSDLEKFDVTEEISRRVDEAEVSPSLLHIEITESADVTEASMLRETVDHLRVAGFEVWMDDFGSGYSSLNSLKNFNFDVIKLDMEFLRNDKGERTWDVIAGIALMVKKLGMRILAEGVETEEQATRLAEAGCDILQGYYFAKPLSLEEIDAKYKDEKTASRK